MSNIIVCIINIAFSLFLLIVSCFFPVSMKQNIPSASFFPRIVGSILLCLSVYNFIRVIFVLRKNKKSFSAEKNTIAKAKIFQLLEIILLLFAYAVLWQLHIGHFLLNSFAAFIPVSILLGNEVAWYKSTIYTICLIIFIYLFFTLLLRVKLW